MTTAERQAAIKTEMAKARQQAIEAGIMTGEEWDRELAKLVDELRKDEEFKRSIGM